MWENIDIRVKIPFKIDLKVEILGEFITKSNVYSSRQLTKLKVKTHYALIWD
jgi:hypothetical protein